MTARKENTGEINMSLSEIPAADAAHSLKRLSREPVCRGSIVDLYRDTVQLPDGKIQEWDYVHHKKGSGSAVVPVWPDGRILLVAQYRPAIGRTELELPAGGRDRDGEDPAETARRELEEETGCRADHMEFLCRLMTAVAWTNEQTFVYLADPIRRTGHTHPDEAEEIRTFSFPLSDLLSMILNGTVDDAKTVAGILAYAARLSMTSR